MGHLFILGGNGCGDRGGICGAHRVACKGNPKPAGSSDEYGPRKKA